MSRAGSARPEPGSFRDPDSRVLVSDEGVFRVLSEAGLADWQALSQSELFERAVADGSLIATRPANGDGAAMREAEDRARRAARRGPASRADPVRLLPVRVDVRDAARRRPAPARPPSRVARRGADPQGRDALQRPVRRRAAGVHRRRVLRAPARGRAVGRLPPVLHAGALSADDPGRTATSRSSRCFAVASRGSRRQRRRGCSTGATGCIAAC